MRKLVATIAAAVAFAGAAVATQAVSAADTPASASWMFQLLPYIEHDNVFRAIQQDYLGNNPGNQGRNFVD